MKLRKTLAAAGALAIAGSMLAVSPSQAATTGSTTATFSVLAGELAITVPTSVAATAFTQNSSVLTGTSVTGALGTTTVSDTRNTALATAVTVKASSTGFTHSTDSTKTIAASNATLATGTVTFSGGMVASSTALPATETLATAGGQTILLALTTGNGQASYSPTLTVTVPGGTTSGTYSGAVTQTVS